MINKDISVYIQQIMQSDRNFSRWKTVPTILSTIEAEMLKKTNGM